MSQSAPIYQVSDLVGEMRRLVEASYPEIWIEGELSSLSTPASGHVYFSLKDQQSQLRCAMFRNRAGISRYRPKAGDLVRVRAKISVYTARGDLQCIVQHIEEAGEGQLQRQFEELKHKLNQAGLLSSDHKRALPSFAKCIGVVTSPSGAAIKDVLSTLARRAPGIPVIIYPAVVQGEGGAASIRQALVDAEQHNQADVVILTRGGGSMEDLWCFNDEALANMIYNYPMPIVSGVGHEVDVTIADLVADHRAPTPTAAAELLSPDNEHLIAQLKSMAFRLPRIMQRELERHAQNVDVQFHQLVHPRQRVRHSFLQLQQRGNRLQQAIKSRLSLQRTQLTQQQIVLTPKLLRQPIERHHERLRLTSQRLQRSQAQLLGLRQQRFAAISDQLNLVSPLATLGRGFSIARDQQGEILRDAKQASTDDTISLELKSGSLDCKVLRSS